MISYLKILVLFCLSIDLTSSFIHSNINFSLKKPFHRSLCMQEDGSNSYLNNLEKKKKLISIQQNIQKYIDSKNASKSETVISKFNYPVEKVTFDNIFLKINLIRYIYISSDYDRVVFLLNNSKKYVFWIQTMEDKQLIDKIINFINQPIKVIVICDKTLFTDIFGFLYCKKE